MRGKGEREGKWGSEGRPKGGGGRREGRVRRGGGERG